MDNPGLFRITFFMQFKFFMLIILLSGCCTSRPQNIPIEKETLPFKNLLEATVIDYREIAGCNFLLELPSGKKLNPENLDKRFRKDQLKVQVRYHVTNALNACMAGETIFIDFIRIADEK